ncbi:E3 ubiquitin/ISG15 ligase TRIM25-like isoform X1 [Myxocyprinus asiaticus]|uniref:E3 ubiquitin/ISG15 ligase TRIM25-like isoform X1 n=1 Tax=Myxocyprinus asiaticus TaxID=70543 RepID=UPI0022226BBB|nr:E3 ubiquitin/ISG15 ligase TRIM25-like isoform X1 [Myxocyprinus asiaticus]
MAEGSFSQDQFSCSVCLDLLKDPVTIPCGHSYCMSCITDCWDQDDQKGVYSCPQCRHSFTTRPALFKNVMFAEVLEKLKKTKLQTARPAHCYAGPGDVECDVCTGKKYKAVKSCLECLNSYCQNHLEQHENLFKDRRHNLMDPTRRLHEMICSKHNKQLEIYCRTDQMCICYLCTMDEHKNHDTVTAAAERTEKQSLLGETQRKLQKRIQESEKKLEELREAVKSHKRSAQTAVEDSERIFTELLRSIERSRSEVTQLIRDQEKAALSQAEGLLERLEQEIADLRRRDAELGQISHTHDNTQFLQSFQSLSAPPESTVLSNITVSSLLSFDDVGKSVSKLKEKLQDFCKEIEKIADRGKVLNVHLLSKISFVSFRTKETGGEIFTFTVIMSVYSLVTNIKIIPSKEPKIREEFLQYSSQFTLDSNTVNKYLRLSEGNRVVTYTDTVQQYPDHPDRFDGVSQVLCRESVCGRCYWEIEWSGSYGVDISVSYKNITRTGRIKCAFRYNNQSWSLYCSPSRYSFVHNTERTELPVSHSSSRIGVYVDHSAGTLSFYSVSDTMTLIHREQTTFTQPLYPGFVLNRGSTVKLCH